MSDEKKSVNVYMKTSVKEIGEALAHSEGISLSTLLERLIKQEKSRKAGPNFEALLADMRNDITELQKLYGNKKK